MDIQKKDLRLMMTANDMRGQINDIRQKIIELQNEISDVLADFTIAEKEAKEIGREFSEDYFEDYMGWLSDLEELNKLIEVKELNI